MLDFDQLVEDTTIEPEITVPDSVRNRIHDLFKQGGLWTIPSVPEGEMDRFRKVMTEAAHQVDRSAYVHAIDGDTPGTKRVTVRLRLKGGRKSSNGTVGASDGDGVEIGHSAPALSGRTW
jgi:hypothetical protein